MKIAVCIKQVVTREWQLRVNDKKTWIRDQDALDFADRVIDVSHMLAADIHIDRTLAFARVRHFARQLR